LRNNKKKEDEKKELSASLQGWVLCRSPILDSSDRCKKNQNRGPSWRVAYDFQMPTQKKWMNQSRAKDAREKDSNLAGKFEDFLC
jgi:hypothetical protein